MAIRKDGILISDELSEKLNSLGFTNETNHTYSVEEVYIAKVINDTGFSFSDLKSSYIFDVHNKCVRRVNSCNDKVICFNEINNDKIEIELDKIFILPTWFEIRQWLKNNHFVMEFHYDPFREGHIKIGFMKPKSFTGTDNLVIEAQGKTDLEAGYKVLLEAIKYDKNIT